MQTETPSLIRHWSTDAVLPPRRLDHYAEALNSAVDPMRLASRTSGPFHAEIQSAALGPLTVIRSHGSAHRCARGEAEIALSSERSIHLRISSTPWRLTHRGVVAVRADDAVLLDSELPMDLEANDFDVTHVKIPYSWLRQWMPSPARLAGLVIAHDSRWGEVLAAFARRITPELVSELPLPASLLADQFAGLLVLAATGTGHATVTASPWERSLRERIEDCIAQRCTEPLLQAADIAAALDMSLRTLHRVMAAGGTTFGTQLVSARVKVAVRMLESPLFDRVTTAEIGRRAGFADASHFARVVRSHFGCSPRALRKSRDLR